MKELTDRIHEINPDLLIGNSVSSWYNESYRYGINWASNRYPVKDDWAVENYYKTGNAHLFNFLCVECRLVLKVEENCDIAMEVVMNDSPVYAGIKADDYNGKPDEYMNALKTGIKSTNGLYINGLSNIEENSYWPIIAKCLGGSTKYFTEPRPNKNPRKIILPERK